MVFDHVLLHCYSYTTTCTHPHQHDACRSPSLSGVLFCGRTRIRVRKYAILCYTFLQIRSACLVISLVEGSICEAPKKGTAPRKSRVCGAFCCVLYWYTG